MKKIYTRPTAQVVAFNVEESLAMMVGSNQGESIRQDDDWSNQREWNAPSWSDAEASED